MAMVTGGTVYPLDLGTVPIYYYYGFMHITEATPSHFAGDYRDIDKPDFASDFFGTGFHYRDDEPVSGTITSFQDSFNGALIQRIAGISVSVPLFDALGDGFITDAAYATLLSGNDTIIGTPLDDDVQGYAGNDDYHMGGGNDLVINEDPGNDLVDGGPGFDTVFLNGSQAEFLLPTWHGQVGVVPGSPGALAAEGVDKLIAVEQLNFADDPGFYTVGSDNFSPLDYVASYADLSNALDSNAQAGFDHYVYSGAFEGRAVTFSGWEYLASYGDLEGAFGLNPDAASSHYITTGRFEGRTTSFDGLEYIASQPDLIAAFGADDDAGARHYLTNGRAEGRQVTFDGLEYIASQPDLIAALGPNRDAGSTHFITYGFSENRHETFDGLQYIASHPDLIAALGPNQDSGSTHFIIHGSAENRPTDQFDEVQYLANYSDLNAAFGNDTDAATVHYITYGHAEHRTDQPLATAAADFLL